MTFVLTRNAKIAKLAGAMKRWVFPVVMLALLLCQLRALAFTADEIAGTWNFTLIYPNSAPIDLTLEFGADGSITIPDNQGSGTFTVSDDSVTITFTADNDQVVLVGTLNGA